MSRLTAFVVISCALVLCAHLHCASSEESVEQKLVNIENRLKEHVELDRPRCGKSPWQSQYAELHKSILSSADPKILVAIPHLSGMYRN